MKVLCEVYYKVRHDGLQMQGCNIPGGWVKKTFKTRKDAEEYIAEQKANVYDWFNYEIVEKYKVIKTEEA